MLTTSGVKLLDFGMAALALSPEELVATERIDLYGTLPYIAPEQLRGEPLGYAVDLYAIGAILYEMINGTRAFSDRIVERLMSAILNVPPAPPTSEVPAAIDRIARKCLSKRPQDRHASASELLDDLRRLQRTASLAAPDLSH